jgi:hypothetical protein
MAGRDVDLCDCAKDRTSRRNKSPAMLLLTHLSAEVFDDFDTEGGGRASVGQVETE